VGVPYRHRGSITLIEAAITLPVLLGLLFGVLDCGRVLATRATLKAVSLEVSRCLFPTQGTCRLSDTKRPLEEYQWWLSESSNRRPYPPAMIFSVSARVPQRLDIEHSGVRVTEYDQVRARGSFHYLEISSRSIDIANSQFVAGQQVIRHDYVVRNASLLGELSSSRLLVSSRNFETVTVPLANPYVHIQRSIRWCRTNDRGNQSRFSSCVVPGAGGIVPLTVLIRGTVENASSQHSPLGKRPVVRIQYRSGSRAGDLGGRVLSGDSTEANFVPRGTQSALIGDRLVGATNISRELSEHAEVFGEVDAQGSLSPLELTFWIEKEHGAPRWRLDSVRVYSDHLIERETKPFLCSQGAIFSSLNPPSLETCRFKEAHNSVSIPAETLELEGVLPQNGREVQGCFSSLQDPLLPLAHSFFVEQGQCDEMTFKRECPELGEEASLGLLEVDSCDLQLCEKSRGEASCCNKVRALFARCGLESIPLDRIRKFHIERGAKVLPFRLISPRDPCDPAETLPRKSELPEMLQARSDLTFDLVSSLPYGQSYGSPLQEKIDDTTIRCKSSGEMYSVSSTLGAQHEEFLGVASLPPQACRRGRCRRERLNVTSESRAVDELLSKATRLARSQIDELFGNGESNFLKVAIQQDVKTLLDTTLVKTPPSLSFALTYSHPLFALFGSRISLTHHESMVLEPG
jgi:TadE-like protein